MSRNIILEVVNWTFSISQVIDSIIVASIAIFVITEIDGITIATTTVGIIIIVAATATGDHDQEAIHAREAHTIDAMIVIHRQSLHHLHHKTHPNHLMLAQRKINKLAFIAFIFFPKLNTTIAIITLNYTKCSICISNDDFLNFFFFGVSIKLQCGGC